LDGNQELKYFAGMLEACTVETIEDDKMTKDLTILKLGTSKVPRNSYLNTEEFIDAVSDTLNRYVTIQK